MKKRIIYTILIGAIFIASAIILQILKISDVYYWLIGGVLILSMGAILTNLWSSPISLPPTMVIPHASIEELIKRIQTIKVERKYEPRIPEELIKSEIAYRIAAELLLHNYIDIKIISGLIDPEAKFYPHEGAEKEVTATLEILIPKK